MARTPRDVGVQRSAVARINVALNLAVEHQRGSADEFKCVTTARDISDRFLRRQQDPVLDRLASPEVILAPLNVVVVYVRDSPMWESWSDSATAAVNARMLPFVQQLNPGDPVPDDPRLALSLTVAGLYLFRALHVGPCAARRVEDREDDVAVRGGDRYDAPGGRGGGEWKCAPWKWTANSAPTLPSPVPSQG